MSIKSKRGVFLVSVAAVAAGLVACGGGNEADAVGVASICEVDEDCPIVLIDGVETQLECITDFSGGYCSIAGCESAVECPVGSTCVAHTDGVNYCFRECTEKAECNANRPVDDEANCSASFDYADSDDDTGLKACIPPSSGD